jgi:hypothetical protein
MNPEILKTKLFRIGINWYPMYMVVSVIEKSLYVATKEYYRKRQEEKKQNPPSSSAH